MASACTICISSLLNPVSIPCGHIFCEKCLHDYIDSSPQIAVSATCPTCRQPFPIVTPDLSLLPKKYHSFLFPSIRRIYIDPPNTPALDKLVKRVKNLERERDTLVEQCERHMNNSLGHKKSEQEAWNEVDRLEEVMHDRIDEQEKELRKLRKENARLLTSLAELEERHEVVIMQKEGLEDDLEAAEQDAQGLQRRVRMLESRLIHVAPLVTKRKPIATRDSEDEDDELEHPSKRPVRPIPLRMRLRLEAD